MTYRIVPVTAHIRGDPAEGRRRRLPPQVVEEAVAPAEQTRDVLVAALARFQNRLEPWKREMLWQVLVGRVRDARVGLRLAARRSGRAKWSAAHLHSGRRIGCPGAGIAEVLGIALPAHVGRIELVEQRLHAGRVDAAVRAGRGVGALRGGHLAVVGVVPQRTRSVDMPREVVVVRAVHLRVSLRGLAADERDVVIEAEVARSEVVLEQDAL